MPLPKDFGKECSNRSPGLGGWRGGSKHNSERIQAFGMAKRQTKRELSNSEMGERLRSILINAADGQRSVADDRQYQELRSAIMSRGLDPPAFLFTHPTIDSFSAAIKRIPTKDARVRAVQDQFEPFFDLLQEGPPPVHSDDWTGQTSRTARLQTVRTLLPLAQTAVESMITTLSQPNDNGAPLLDSRLEAIEQLKQLHGALGQLLTAIDQGHLDDDLGENLQAEVARFAKRTAKALRDDPMPYLSSALLLGLFAACGIPGLGGYMSGVALTIKKHVGK